MNFYIKYSTSKYKRLCFKHATMEAMHGEKVETDIIDPSYFTLAIASCDLCVADKDKSKIVLREWYENLRKNK